MPSATETATKTLIMRVDRLCELSAFISWALLSIQLSACSPVRPRTRAAMRSAANRSSTVTSITVTPPGSASSDCACLRST